jgi:transposase
VHNHVKNVIIQIIFTDAEITALDYERYHHPCPQVQKRMDSISIKSQGLAHQEIARICQISRQTLVTSVHRYKEGGIAALKELHYHGPPSALNPYQSTVEAHVRAHPPQMIEEAQAVIAQRTGIQRSPTQIRAFLRRMGMRLRTVGAVPGHAQDPEKQAGDLSTGAVRAAPRRGACG